MAFVALQMFRSGSSRSRYVDINGLGIHWVSLSIGSLSALVAIGGGSLTVPYLLWRHIDIKTAICTSAAVGLPIALAGACGYLVAGWGVAIEQEWVLSLIHISEPTRPY